MGENGVPGKGTKAAEEMKNVAGGLCTHDTGPFLAFGLCTNGFAKLPH